MQSIQMDFDMSNVDPYVGGGAPLENGTYPMTITNMEVRENNDKSTGHNLWLEYTVFEGEHKGRKFYENLNLWHQKSSAAAEIAGKQLSSIAHAVGVLQGNDLTVLANKPMFVELILEKGQDRTDPNTGDTIKGREQNRVMRRDPYQQRASQVPGQLAQQQAAPAAAANAAPAFNPAAQQQQVAQQQNAQAAPAFNPSAAAQAQAQAQPAATGGENTAAQAKPPWMK